MLLNNHNGGATNIGGHGENGLSSHQHMRAISLSEKYQQPNLLKPIFISFNSLAYLTYTITILAFVMSKKASTETTSELEVSGEDIEETPWLTTFYRVVSGINGLCFFLLTVSLLNYGTRLEKIVHAIKVKG